MLEQAGLLARGLDRGRRMQIELLAAPDDAATRVERLLERARLVAEARADRVVAFAEARSCRHAQVAEHFGERLDGPCGACDVCAPRDKLRQREAEAPPPLPEDVGAAILDAVRSLRWPLGRRSLVATLRGSLKAPPSARRSPAYRLLAAATDADARRWVKVLEDAGALHEELTSDGYRVLVVDETVTPPRIATASASADAGLVERLRAWRLERSREDGVPAYVVLHDATLHELAAARPTTEGELAGVKGLGPVKVDRYGGDLLALIASG